jgi:hypothetical protein
MSRKQNVGQNRNIKITNKFIHGKIFRVLENDINNQNCMHEDTKSRLNQENVYTIGPKSFVFQLFIEEHKE